MPDPYNLLPEHAIHRYARRSLIRQWFQIVLFLGSFSILVIVATRSWSHQEIARAQRLQAVAAEPRALAAQNEKLQNKLKSIRRTVRRAEEQKPDYSPLNVIMLLADVTAALDGQLTVNSLEFKLNEKVPSRSQRSGQARQNKTNGQVSIGVKASEFRLAHDLLGLLRESGLFASVKIADRVEQLSNNDQAVRFLVHCDF